MENSGFGLMISESEAGIQASSDSRDNFLCSLNKRDSVLSLTLDEIKCKSGKNFGGMSMDEFLANIWNVEDIQSQFHSQLQTNENEPQDRPFMAVNDSRPALYEQGSISIPIPLCGKTVDEIWSEIHKDEQNPHRQKFINVQQNACQSQQALREMTLEDFLVKAGVVQEASSSCSMKQQQQACSLNNLGLSLSYQQNDAPRIRNMSGNCFSTYQMLTPSVGEPSDSSSIQKCQSLTDWAEPSNKKRIVDGPTEVVVQRRQRRMIKNRESAARSRARKQAYTVELESELKQLKEENVKLKQIMAESERKRKQEILQRKPEKRQKPTQRLMTMRRNASTGW
ncbi:ABSCISIC ACID-INSENSITIVE 5-like protein 1 isoform X1 [Cucurbita maxima]|uniref:ABSCISIC ACID-INSENSITIVE 5-like protein 1 isoform X1 n=1 Tax=Cucurbita maxima TaxID=3661 RepID=A0A6J1JEN2_CUCMA|nr:ABSCISIC ACID-INSENSITIVE 5-like protein 1 isoform X1 [Cucurbita maxima]